jgi:hypothetical protein
MDQPTATPTPTAEIPLERLAKMYLKMRDKVQELTRAYESEVEAIKLQQATVSGAMKDRVRAMGDGISSVKTEHGTIMLSTKTRYYAQDWEAFGAFVIKQGDVSLLEKRVAQGNMAAFLTEHPDAAPPGLSSISEIEVSVRKPAAK